MHEKWSHRHLEDKWDVIYHNEDDILKASRDDISSVLIREFIQNALDNLHPNEEKVIVNIEFVQHVNLELYFGDLKKHLGMQLYNTAKDTQMKDVLWNYASTQISKYQGKGQIPKARTSRIYDQLFRSTSDCMILEDYHTTGLTGKVSRKYDPSASKSDEKFERYIFNHGGSTERKKSGGSHGSGRKSALYASCIHSKIIYTRREESPNEVVIGLSETPPRQKTILGKNQEAYLQRSYFLENDEGITNKEKIEKLKDIFKLRSLNSEYVNGGIKTGLSAIIPFPDKRLTDEKLKLDILLSYSYSILFGDIVIVQHSRASSEKWEYTNSNILEYMKEIEECKGENEDIKRQKRRIIALHEILENLLELQRPDIQIDLRKEEFSVNKKFSERVEDNKDMYRRIKRKYFGYKHVYVHVKKKMVYEKERKENTGTFEIYLKRTRNRGYSFFMRNFTMLVDETEETNGFISLTIAKTGTPYEELLKACEPADHKKLKKGNNPLKVKSYTNYLRCFRRGYRVGNFLETLGKEKKDNLADENFTIPLKDRRERKKPAFSYKVNEREFEIKASDMFKNTGRKNINRKVKIKVGFTKTTNKGRTHIMDEKHFPEYVIEPNGNRSQDIKNIIDLGNGETSLDISSRDFCIAGKIEDIANLQFLVECKFVR